jgi:hypothetical protein
MKTNEDGESKVAQKDKLPVGFGPKYLDWWVGSEKPPTYKNLADNLRAYLTIGAYIVLLHYLWFWGDDRIPGWVFQGTAVIWGGCILWFFILAIVQTWHLYFGFCFELLTLFLEPYAKRRKGEVGKYEYLIIEILFLPFAASSIVLIGTVFYLIGAMLRSAKLM